jgi:hypothetical protein
VRVRLCVHSSINKLVSSVVSAPYCVDAARRFLMKQYTPTPIVTEMNTAERRIDTATIRPLPPGVVPDDLTPGAPFLLSAGHGLTVPCCTPPWQRLFG